MIAEASCVLLAASLTAGAIAWDSITLTVLAILFWLVSFLWALLIFVERR